MRERASAGALAAALHLPTVIVQEGGYNPEVLGTAARHFLEPFTSV